MSERRINVTSGSWLSRAGTSGCLESDGRTELPDNDAGHKSLPAARKAALPGKVSMSLVQAQQAARSRQLRPEAHVPVAVSDVLRPGALLRELELRIAEQTGSQFALVMSGREQALRVAVEAVGLHAGDRIGLPVTAGSWLFDGLQQAGFGIVALPVDMSSLTICPQAAEEALRSGCRALLVGHFHGRRAPASELHALALDYGACLLEDATQAVCLECQGRTAGTWGRAGLFSLGEPGQPEDQLHGILASSPDVVGRITELLSSQLVAQAVGAPSGLSAGPSGGRVLKSLDWLTATATRHQRWRQQWSLFRARLAGIPGLRVLDVDVDSGEAPSAVDLLVDRPQVVIDALSSSGVACQLLVTDATADQLRSRQQASPDSRAVKQLDALKHAVSLPWEGERSTAQILSICQLIDCLLRRSLAA